MGYKSTLNFRLPKSSCKWLHKWWNTILVYFIKAQTNRVCIVVVIVFYWYIWQQCETICLNHYCNPLIEWIIIILNYHLLSSDYYHLKNIWIAPPERVMGMHGHGCKAVSDCPPHMRGQWYNSQGEILQYNCIKDLLHEPSHAQSPASLFLLPQCQQLRVLRPPWF